MAIRPGVEVETMGKAKKKQAGKAKKVALHDLPAPGGGVKGSTGSKNEVSVEEVTIVTEFMERSA